MSDEIHNEIANIKRNVRKAYDRKRAATIALCRYYAGMALAAFWQKQSGNKFWTNRTGVARDTVFGDAFDDKDVVGWFLAHTQEYGVYLELANNRKHAALLPVVLSFYSRFQRDLAKIFED